MVIPQFSWRMPPSVVQLHVIWYYYSVVGSKVEGEIEWNHRRGPGHRHCPCYFKGGTYGMACLWRCFTVFICFISIWVWWYLSLLMLVICFLPSLPLFSICSQSLQCSLMSVFHDLNHLKKKNKSSYGFVEYLMSFPNP